MAAGKVVGREDREAKYTQKIRVMISCSFTSVEAFFFLLPHTLSESPTSLKFSQNEFPLPLCDFSNSYKTYECSSFASPVLREGEEPATWAHEGTVLSASDEIILQLTF